MMHPFSALLREGKTMRLLAVSLGLGLLLMPGCDWSKNIIRQDNPPKTVGGNTAAPEATQLVAYMNDNARRVQAVQANSVAIDCKQGNESIGIEAKLVCQKPRYFRLKGNVLGKPGVDIGSNEDEFWYWISQEKPPYVFHCSYPDLSTGRVRLPFPFQPDMIVSAMGISEYDANKTYELKVVGQTLEMTEPAITPEGKRVRKVTVFSRYECKAPKPQVLAHILRDENGKEICRASIQEVTVDRTTNAVLPVKVHMSWPEKKMEMTMRLRDVQSARIDTAQASRMFNRTDLARFPGFDLARWKPDQTEGLSQQGRPVLQRVGGESGPWGK
jgi:hypothetical protein